jgi:hypothetical protein
MSQPSIHSNLAAAESYLKGSINIPYGTAKETFENGDSFEGRFVIFKSIATDFL